MAKGPENKPDLTPLTAISPLDGRYWDIAKELSPHASEMAIIQTRVEIEGRYLVALSEAGLVRPLTDQEKGTLTNLGPNLMLSEAERVKEIEAMTHHDVKAMERAFREWVKGTSIEDVTEMIHFGLTSEDVNNLTYRLMLQRAITNVCVPALDLVVDAIVEKAEQYKGVPMLARTHGQPAVPTTVGKEQANTAVRLNRQVRKLQQLRLTGKLDGAVGNFNAHVLAAPEIDWIEFSKKFVSSLGLEPNLFTTQINPYEDMIEMFQTLFRINSIILDIDQDMWRYISDEWMIQQVKPGEVSSSTMPQKVNPIRFENSEGNILMSNPILEGMSRKLSVSRLQRDLSDSTTIRNVGVALGYGLVAHKNTLEGFRRVRANISRIHKDLNENWVILTEGVQTVLRRAGATDPYSMVAGLSRGKKIGPNEWESWVRGLEVDEGVRTILLDLTPETYIGYAERLTDMAIQEIRQSRNIVDVTAEEKRET